jgi:hypothetical protein
MSKEKKRRARKEGRKVSETRNKPKVNSLNRLSIPDYRIDDDYAISIS